VSRLTSIAIVFDCDGTLIDSELLHAKALQASLSAAGIEYDLEELRRRSTGVDNGSFLRQIAAESGVELPGEIEIGAEKLAHRLISNGIRTMPGAAAVVSELARLGVAPAIASNSRARLVAAMLNAVNMQRPFMGRIATSDQVNRPKPAPDVYLLAARMLDVPFNCCLAVEDSPTGVTSARQAGMPVVGFCPVLGAHRDDDLLKAGATVVIDDLRALLLPPIQELWQKH
jgi:HAD superfamily hydrolase (TIGR01509 family)